MGIRRVVTGHDEYGKAVFTSDDTVEPILGRVSLIWAEDTPARFPDDGSVRDELTSFFPPVEGCRFGFVTYPPDAAATNDDIDPDVVGKMMDEHLPGLAAHMEPDLPGMHTSATQDFAMVVSGRIVLELDGGVTNELGPGDVIVQNGTRHRWLNPFDEPCITVAMMRGAAHDGVPPHR
ncbi:MAG: cupin domain-containing protein [Actinomycetota bacterium]